MTTKDGAWHNAAMEQTQWLTLEEMAKTARLHLDTVRRYARDGQIPARKIGKRYLIKATDVEIFMEGPPVTAPEPPRRKTPASAKPAPGRKRKSGD